MTYDITTSNDQTIITARKGHEYVEGKGTPCALPPRTVREVARHRPEAATVVYSKSGVYVQYW
jgi:hypothetical protein